MQEPRQLEEHWSFGADSRPRSMHKKSQSQNQHPFDRYSGQLDQSRQKLRIGDWRLRHYLCLHMCCTFYSNLANKPDKRCQVNNTVRKPGYFTGTTVRNLHFGKYIEQMKILN